MTSLVPSEIILPDRYNYFAVFLTLSCNFKCPYCINRLYDLKVGRRILSGKEWIQAINKVKTRPDLPLTLQGGEPTLHPDFYEIIDGIRPDTPIDLLTNLEFDIDRFMSRIPPERMKREAPYASIRVSYHPGQSNLEEIFSKVLRMLEKGYHIGVWAVMHPDYIDHIQTAMEKGKSLGIDFRSKEFLGRHQGKIHGLLKWKDSSTGNVTRKHVLCRTTELLIDPEGLQFRCHSDLYAGKTPVGNFFSPKWQLEDIFRSCTCYGTCNVCDVKVKTDRFQQFGHTSVEIKFEED